MLADNLNKTENTGDVAMEMWNFIEAKLYADSLQPYITEGFAYWRALFESGDHPDHPGELIKTLATTDRNSDEHKAAHGKLVSHPETVKHAYHAGNILRGRAGSVQKRGVRDTTMRNINTHEPSMAAHGQLGMPHKLGKDEHGNDAPTHVAHVAQGLHKDGSLSGDGSKAWGQVGAALGTRMKRWASSKARESDERAAHIKSASQIGDGADDKDSNTSYETGSKLGKDSLARLDPGTKKTGATKIGKRPDLLKHKFVTDHGADKSEMPGGGKWPKIKKGKNKGRSGAPTYERPGEAAQGEVRGDANKVLNRLYTKFHQDGMPHSEIINHLHANLGDHFSHSEISDHVAGRGTKSIRTKQKGALGGPTDGTGLRTGPGLRSAMKPEADKDRKKSGSEAKKLSRSAMAGLHHTLRGAARSAQAKDPLHGLAVKKLHKLVRSNLKGVRKGTEEPKTLAQHVAALKSHPALAGLGKTTGNVGTKLNQILKRHADLDPRDALDKGKERERSEQPGEPEEKMMKASRKRPDQRLRTVRNRPLPASRGGAFTPESKTTVLGGRKEPIKSSLATKISAVKEKQQKETERKLRSAEKANRAKRSGEVDPGTPRAVAVSKIIRNVKRTGRADEPKSRLRIVSPGPGPSEKTKIGKAAQVASTSGEEKAKAEKREADRKQRVRTGANLPRDPDVEAGTLVGRRSDKKPAKGWKKKKQQQKAAAKAAALAAAENARSGSEARKARGAPEAPASETGLSSAAKRRQQDYVSGEAPESKKSGPGVFRPAKKVKRKPEGAIKPRGPHWRTTPISPEKATRGRIARKAAQAFQRMSPEDQAKHPAAQGNKAKRPGKLIDRIKGSAIKTAMAAQKQGKLNREKIGDKIRREKAGKKRTFESIFDRIFGDRLQESRQAVSLADRIFSIA